MKKNQGSPMNVSTNKKLHPPRQLNTIDQKHAEMLNHFHTLETETIPTLQKERENLMEMIKYLKDSEIDKYMEIKDRVLQLNKKIKAMKSEKKQYLLDNSRYIFDYFEEKIY